MKKEAILWTTAIVSAIGYVGYWVGNGVCDMVDEAAGYIADHLVKKEDRPEV